MLAQHFSLGKLPQQSAKHWTLAGTRASEQSALQEAVIHARKGLEEAAQIPDGETRDALELELYLILGPALMNLTRTVSHSKCEMSSSDSF